MKLNSILTIAIAAGIAGSSVPLDAAPAAAPAPTLMEQLEVSLGAREKRAAWTHYEIKTLDSRIEERLEVILEALRSISDSKDSRTKVARMKEQTIDTRPLAAIGTGPLTRSMRTIGKTSG